MGKLNYVKKRKIDGIKLGQVIAKDVTKRIQPGPGNKAALRDPIVDFDVSGKELDDEVFTLIIDAFSEAIRVNNDEQPIFKLEELCLKGNRLTVSSLKSLAEVIELCSSSLQDLDLSDNQIKIESCEEVECWEVFLKSLSSSYNLRRIDLSGNPLGLKAFEVLTRLYIQEKNDGRVANGSNDVSKPVSLAKSFSIQNGNGHPAHGRRKDSFGVREVGQKRRDSETQSSDKGEGPPCHLTRGLKSIPYIILDNTGIDDPGAMYISYLIAEHQMPQELLRYVPAAKAGAQANQIESYNDDANCRGIMYRDNLGMSSAGNKVCSLAELERGNIAGVGAGEHPHNGTSHEEALSFENTPPGPIGFGKSSRYKASPMKLDGLPESFNKHQESTELQRARSRIQGDLLKEKGVAVNDLWHRSIKMLAMARNIIVQPRPKEKEIVWPANDVDDERSLDNGQSPERNASAQAPAISMPLVYRLRKTSSGGILTPERTPMPTDKNPAPPKNESGRLATTLPSGPYRSNLPCGFSVDTWSQILGFAVDKQGFMSKAQRRNVIEWALDRRTLDAELRTLGKPEGAQIWYVLDGMGCLAYEETD